MLLLTFDYIQLLNKPYVHKWGDFENEKPILKCCQSLEQKLLTTRSRCFQRGQRYCESVEQRAAKLWSVKF